MIPVWNRDIFFSVILNFGPMVIVANCGLQSFISCYADRVVRCARSTFDPWFLTPVAHRWPWRSWPFSSPSKSDISDSRHVCTHDFLVSWEWGTTNEYLIIITHTRYSSSSRKIHLRMQFEYYSIKYINYCEYYNYFSFHFAENTFNTR